MGRYLSAPPFPPERPDGARQCRYCGTDELEPGRRCWCSQRCVDEYNVRAGNDIRLIVFARDGGVCAECGLDTTRVERSIFRVRGPGGVHRWAQLMSAFGRPVDTHRISFFDVDHIRGVVDGGGGCGLDNLRTLCVWCHKAKTKRQATARARRRQQANGVER